MQDQVVFFESRIKLLLFFFVENQADVVRQDDFIVAVIQRDDSHYGRDREFVTAYLFDWVHANLRRKTVGRDGNPAPRKMANIPTSQNQPVTG
jgi:hypothetical protein